MAVYQIQFCLFNTVSEEDMLASMITYLEEENKTELSSILQVSKFVYSPHWEFFWDCFIAAKTICKFTGADTVSENH